MNKALGILIIIGLVCGLLSVFCIVISIILLIKKEIHYL